jgi:glycosyltransferase involved in cell wall biosynthesis
LDQFSLDYFSDQIEPRHGAGSKPLEKSTVSQAHILYVIRSLEIGGTEQHLLAVAQRLVRRGWKVSVYSLEDAGPLRAEFERYRVNVLVPPSATSKRPHSIAGRVMRLARTAFHLLSLFRKQRPQIVHFLLPAAYLFGAPLAIVARVPIRIMSRQSMNVYQRAALGARIVERFLHQRMHAILAVSLRVLEQLRDEEGAPPSRLGLIYNGIEIESFSSASPKDGARAQLGLGGATLVMVVVANLIPYKGHADLLAALVIARSDLPDDWRLLIVGRDDGIGPQLRDQARRLALDDNVRFLGQRTDIAALLRASDIGILCSHQEGFSIAVLEGMATGLPTIVTDVGGNAEAVIDGTSGLVVPPKDPASLAQAIRRLARDPDLRARLGRAARQRVQQEFSIEDCVRRHERLYRAMLVSSPMSVDQILSDAAIERVRIGSAN